MKRVMGFNEQYIESLAPIERALYKEYYKMEEEEKKNHNQQFNNLGFPK